MKSFLLEVCADSVESVLAAEEGGADRIELCGNIVIGGTTPDVNLYREIRARSGIRIHALIRPRFGDFCYTDCECAVMERDIQMFRELGAQGVVIGALEPDGGLALPVMERLVRAAGGMSVTLHRAFDVCRDPFAALETAKRLGVDTILTSGQQADCTAGADLLRALVAKAGEDVQILVGAGVNADVIRDLQPKTGANAFHLSAKRVENSRMQFRRENVPMGLPGLSEFSLWRCDENAVRAAREAFDACCGAGQEART